MRAYAPHTTHTHMNLDNFQRKNISRRGIYIYLICFYLHVRSSPATELLFRTLVIECMRKNKLKEKKKQTKFRHFINLIPFSIEKLRINTENADVNYSLLIDFVIARLRAWKIKSSHECTRHTIHYRKYFKYWKRVCTNTKSLTLALRIDNFKFQPA